MKKYSLDFCEFLHHEDGILEVIVNEGVELDVEMTKEFFDFIKNVKPKVAKFLVNRVNKYSYTFKANLMLATTKLPVDVAVVKYGNLRWPLKGLFTPKFYHLAFFDDRLEALNWLRLK